MSGPDAARISVVVLGMVAALIAIALLPRHDPLALSDDGRQLYVYGAQIIVALWVAHLYFSQPWLFRLGIKQYWPYLAMLLSFGGVGLANVLQKRDLLVLGRPLFHTGAMLPVVGAAAFWGVDSRADASVVMLLAGLVYLWISTQRESVLSGAAAVVFGNLALWLFYGKYPHFDFLQHPQLWLIPPAASVLTAAQVHRHRLTASQLALLRYLCVTVIYISSTSEILITGLGKQLWPPMVLALLSVAGMFLGMTLRIRAYLYLGSFFLLLSMVTMVAHAQQRLDHVWPWWVFGLVLGGTILAVFGWFEKHRNNLPDLRDRLRSWEY